MSRYAYKLELVQGEAFRVGRLMSETVELAHRPVRGDLILVHCSRNGVDELTPLMVEAVILLPLAAEQPFAGLAVLKEPSA